MEVITDRPIYSYLTAEEKAKKRADRKAKKDANTEPNIFQKTYSGAKKLLESDYGRAGVGVFAQKAKDFADQTTGISRGGLDPNSLQVLSREQIAAEAAAKEQAERDRKRKMYRNVGIAVGVVAVLGITAYFLVKRKKGKTAKK